MARYLLVIMFTVAFSTEVSAQNLARLVSEEFHEELRSEATVSGATVIGFGSFGTIRQRADRVKLQAHFQEGWDGNEVCLRVSSIDGLYDSRNTYSIPEDRSSLIVTIPYPTSELEKLKQYTAGSLTALLSEGPCGSVDYSTPVLVRWGDGAFPNATVMLNTYRSDEVYMFFPEHPSLPEEIDCTVMNGTVRIAYDTMCMLPEGLDFKGTVAVALITFKNGSVMLEHDFSLGFQ